MSEKRKPLDKSTALITLMSLYHTDPQELTSWNITPVITLMQFSSPPSAFFFSVSLLVSIFCQPLSVPLWFLKISVTALLSFSQNPNLSFKTLIKSKSGWLGWDFCWWYPRLSIVLDRPLETVIMGGILLIRRFNKAERPRWRGGSRTEAPEVWRNSRDPRLL